MLEDSKQKSQFLGLVKEKPKKTIEVELGGQIQEGEAKRKKSTFQMDHLKQVEHCITCPFRSHCQCIQSKKKLGPRYLDIAAHY